MNKLKFAFHKDNLPLPQDEQRASVGHERWLENLADDTPGAALIREAAETPAMADLLRGLFGCSPFLTQCMIREHAFFGEILTDGLDARFNALMQEARGLACEELDEATLMKRLRIIKRRAALAAALGDLTGLWSLAQVTGALSDTADHTINAAVAHVLQKLAEGGHIRLADPADPCRDGGMFVLGMGKLGSRELNYSSDVDLIVLYDPIRMRAEDPDALRQACVRATRDLMRIMDSRTADGYVFRTDLRLRPDPGATPLAMTVGAAETYYESLGQNWERAAMIKARIVAGDRKLGDEFLQHIRPFVWRKHLDFAAIQDIHSIKRQINAHRGGTQVAVNGHDIKIGRGGIREIEFFAQTQQLIWGGREPALRQQRTCEAISALHDFGHVKAEALADLTAAYGFLRRLEHRLQMVDDKQTQKMPAEDEKVDGIARFMGFAETEDFRAELLGHLGRVEQHYAMLFEESPDLGGGGSLVFTGTEDDPDTVETLTNMGFSNASTVSGLTRTWHMGRYRATRSERARQLLTELMPRLLKALADTTNPDEAFVRFDKFLSGLPAGVQLFSLFQAYPALLDLVAEIMGDAPKLAEWLARKPILLDAVLSVDFYDPCENRKAMAEQLEINLRQARDYQDVLDIVRRWCNDLKFKTGVQLLRGASNGSDVGPALSDMAETAIDGLLPALLQEFEQAHGRTPGDGLAVVAFGKLGGRELLPESDLDLVYVYDNGDGEASDGDKPLTPTVYHIRLCQRLSTAISSQTGEGRLYEVDNRLRPAGNSGPIATQLSSFEGYYDLDGGGEAWVWEHMALTRARVTHGNASLRKALEGIIHRALTQKRNAGDVVVQVAAMRARIAKQHSGASPWDIKYRRGGLVDIEFIAQYLQLIHAHDKPQVLHPNTARALEQLAEAGALEDHAAQSLLKALDLWRRLQAMLRLTASGVFDEEAAPLGQKEALVRATSSGSFAELKATMEDAAASVRILFDEIIEGPAAQLADKGDESK